MINCVFPTWKDNCIYNHRKYGTQVPIPGFIRELFTSESSKSVSVLQLLEYKKECFAKVSALYFLSFCLKGVKLMIFYLQKSFLAVYENSRIFVQNFCGLKWSSSRLSGVFPCNKRKIGVKATIHQIQLSQKQYLEKFKVTDHKYQFWILKIIVFLAACMLADISYLVKLQSNH